MTYDLIRNEPGHAIGQGAVMSEVTKQPPAATAPSWVSQLGQNPIVTAIVIGAGSAVLIAIRLISTGNFDIETTYGILQASGTGSIIVGTTISLIPGISACLAAGCALLITYYHPRTRSSFVMWATLAFFTITAVLTCALVYVPLLLLIVVATLVALLMRRRIEAEPNRTTHVFLIFLAILTAVALIIGVINSPPWVAEERFIFKDHAPVSGYLLAQTDVVTTILQAKPRVIEFFDTSEIVDQSACRPGSSISLTVMSLFTSASSAAHYPAC